MVMKSQDKNLLIFLFIKKYEMDVCLDFYFCKDDVKYKN